MLAFFAQLSSLTLLAQLYSADGSQDLQQDLSVACLKAIVPLLDGLVVHSIDPSSSSKTTDARRESDICAERFH